MLLDRLSGDEQLLGDLDVAEALRRELRRPELARGQRVDAGAKDAARARAGRRQLVSGPGGEPIGAADVGELERPAERLA